MILVIAKPSLLGAELDRIELDPQPDLTLRDIVLRMLPLMPPGSVLDAAMNGRLVDVAGEEGGRAIEDGSTVIVCPRTSGEVIVGAIVYALVTVAVSYAVAYLTGVLNPRPRPTGLGQERGDETSATYSSWGMDTSYGPGLPVPWGFGRHALPGQVIWSDVEASRTTPTFVDDRLRMIIALCEGPIHRVGNVVAASIDGMGGFAGGVAGPAIPSGIDINGNLLSHLDPLPGVRMWLRPGTQDHPTLPAPFSGTGTIETVNLSLDTTAQLVTLPEVAALSMLRFVFVAPAGLYRQGPTGSLLVLDISVFVQWRIPGQLSWTYVYPTLSPQSFTWRIDPNGPYLGYHAATITLTPAGNYGFPVNMTGPLELRVGKLVSGGAAQGVVSSLTLRDVVSFSSHQLRYPNIALLGLELTAGVRWSGGRPNVKTIVDMQRVRVWDATNGWSPECWDLPAAPWNFNTYAPGRNPAWCLLAFIRARFGLANWFPESRVDLPAFRRWAAFCDSDPDPATPWLEPAHTVDLVGDRPRPVWEWVIAFCAAGRASPVMRNGKLSVTYQYAASHGDAGITVPAKEPTQLLTSGMVDSFQVNWISKANRPSTLLFQFLDEALRYEQDVEPVEDDEGSLNVPSALDKDTYRPETVQAYGITRRQQLFREGKFRHRVMRLIDRELTIRTGRWSLGAEVGDTFLFEYQGLRPFANDVPRNMQIVSVGFSELVVDHHLSGTGLRVIVRQPDGTPSDEIVISSYVNGDDGAAVNPKKRCTLTLASVVDAAPGGTCVVGLPGKLVEAYEFHSIRHLQNGMVEAKAFNWDPNIHAPVTKASWLAAEESVDAPPVEQSDTDELPPEVFGIRLVALGEAAHQLTWARPGNKATGTARVWIREAGQAWRFVGSTETSSVRVEGLSPGTTYEVSVCLENRRGETVPPDLGDIDSVVADEFPAWSLPTLTNVRAQLLDGFVLVEWDELQQKDLDYFEVRAGSCWASATIFARDRAPRVYLPNPPVGVPLLVAARSRSGLYGEITVVPDPGWAPPDQTQVAFDNDLAPSPAGTHSGTVWNSTDGVLELTSGALTGTYTSVELDAGVQLPHYWQVRIDRQEIEDLTLDDLVFEIDSGEALWRTLDGRPASPAAPGIDWQLNIDDLTMTIDELPETLLVQGHVGEVGAHTFIAVESRFEVDGAWTAYRPHYDRRVLARKMQVRLSFYRASTGYLARVKTLAYAAYI